MKKHLSLLLFLSVALLASCGGGTKYSYETIEGDPMGTRIYTLDNGLKVYLSQTKAEPNVFASIAVHAGSKDDPAQSTGLAHYLEHLMFKGSERLGTLDYAKEKPLLDEIENLYEEHRKADDADVRKAIYARIDSLSYEASRFAVAREYDKLNSVSNAFTHYDITCYIDYVPVNKVEAWAAVNADRFKNPVFRGFHTELETVYQEYNMYKEMDAVRAQEALFASMFKNHPYKTPVIGLQQHLKNPSIKDVKEFHKKYYVPNNMAVCMSGDLDFDTTIALIDRYFGDMQPSADFNRPKYEPEAEITAPIVTEIYGKENESMNIFWRIPDGVNDELLDFVANIMCNGQVGIVDKNLVNSQKVLSSVFGGATFEDYGFLGFWVTPKEGQTLDEVKALMLAQVDSLRKGRFDDELIQAVRANMKRDAEENYLDNASRADLMHCHFIFGDNWVEDTRFLDKVTKEDVVAFANKYLGDNNYVALYKRQGENKDNTVIEAPEITPIETNPDTMSVFCKELLALESGKATYTPVDFEKEMSVDRVGNLPVYYKENTTDGLFNLEYWVELGSRSDKRYPVAVEYVNYLGTDEMTADEFKEALYSLACTFNITVTNDIVFINLYGLNENMEKAAALVEIYIAGLQPDESALAELKADILKKRADDKNSREVVESRLSSYAVYGRDFTERNILSEKELNALTSAELIGCIKDLFAHEHKIIYFGATPLAGFKKSIAGLHRCDGDFKPVPAVNSTRVKSTADDAVYVVPFDGDDVTIYAVSSVGELFNLDDYAPIELYSSVFSDVFMTEIREKRGMSYYASAWMEGPMRSIDPYCYKAVLQTQSDKMVAAMKAADEAIENMPMTETAFSTGKETFIKNRFMMSRYSRSGIIVHYLDMQFLGFDYDIQSKLYDDVLALTYDDIVKYHAENIKGRKFHYYILCPPKAIDKAALSKFGEVRILPLEEVMGY